MRLLLRDLSPATIYNLQVRSKKEGASSEWSPKFTFTTTSYNTPPAIPANITWVSNGDSFHGEWDKVVTNTSGDPANIDRYEIELTGMPGNAISYAAVPQVTSGTKVVFDLSFAENVAKFIVAKPTVNIRVASVDIRGNRSAWSTSFSAGNPPPAAPTGLAAAANFEYVDVSWNSVADTDLVGYNLYLSLTGAGGPYNRVYQGTSLNYSFPSSNYTTDHYFQVRAYDTFGQESSASNTAGPVRPKSAFVVDTVPPAAPTGLSASSSNNSNGIGAYSLVSWTPPGDADLAGFVVRFRKSGTSDNYFTQTYDKGTTSVQIDLPLSNTAYDFQIRAFDRDANYSAYTSVVTAAAPSNPVPSNVTGLTSVAGKESITYSWTAISDSDLRDYEVTFSTSPTFASGNTTFYAGSPTLTVSGLTSNTTYYARVRARDAALQPSSAWSSTDTRTTGTYATQSLTDGLAPTSSPAATASAGISNIFVSWAKVTNADPVTYEVHISTTAGFTPTLGGATKVAETPGTIVTLDKDASGTALSYATPYYFRIIAKDADTTSGNAPTAGTVSAPTSPRKAGSGDIITITADQIGTSSLSTSVITMTGTGSIQSSVFNSTTGFKISSAGIELNDANSKVSVAALQGGTISASSQIILGPSANLIVNGGYIQSNTYTPGSAGFKIGTTGIELNDANSKVKVDALVTGTISGTTTITMSGANAKIIGGGFELSGSGLLIPNGGVQAAALNIQVGQNIAPYAVATMALPLASTPIISSSGTIAVDSVSYNFCPQSMKVTQAGATSSVITMATTTSENNITIPELGSTYIISMWIRPSVTNAVNLGFYNGATVHTDVVAKRVSDDATTLTASAWQRIYMVTNTVNIVGGNIRLTLPAIAGTWNIDGVQFEKKMGGTNKPSEWTPPSTTTIDGSMVKTGSIISNQTTTVGGATVPTWSIPLNGFATFNGLTVRGVTTLGVSGDAGNSSIKSWNYSGVGGTGWMMDANGNLIANSGTFGGALNAATGSFSGSLSAAYGTFTGTVTAGTVETSTSANTSVVRMNSSGFKIYGTSTTPLVDFSIGLGTMIIGGITVDTTGMQSSNYPTTGWRIDNAGNATFKSGTFSGSITGATGTFSGSLSIGGGANNHTTSIVSGTGWIEMWDQYSIGSHASIASSASGLNSYIRLAPPNNSSGLLTIYDNGTVAMGSTLQFNSTPANINFNGTLVFQRGISVGIGGQDMNGYDIRMGGGQLTGAGGITISTGGLTVNAGGVTISGASTFNGTTSFPGTISGTVQLNSLADGAANNQNTGTKYVRASANGTLYSYTTGPSSREIKHDINLLEFDYRQILKLEPKTYRFNEAPDLVRAGFIAEEAHDLGLTLWVGYEANDSDKPTGFDYDGYVTALHIVNQEQQKQIDNMADQIEELRGMIQDLTSD